MTFCYPHRDDFVCASQPPFCEACLLSFYFSSPHGMYIAAFPCRPHPAACKTWHSLYMGGRRWHDLIRWQPLSTNQSHPALLFCMAPDQQRGATPSWRCCVTAAFFPEHPASFPARAYLADVPCRAAPSHSFMSPFVLLHCLYHAFYLRRVIAQAAPPQHVTLPRRLPCAAAFIAMALLRVWHFYK